MSSPVSRARLTLYVAGDLPNSRRARLHLADWLQRSSMSADEVEVVDVLTDPGRAAEDDIFITPALVFSGESGRQLFVGDLSDDAYLGSLQPDVSSSSDSA